MKVVLLLIVLGVSQSNAWFFGSSRVQAHEVVSQTCLRLAEAGNCEFYDCLERRFPCGHDGFTLSVGKHFCNKMADAESRLTPTGRTWMNSTSQCLTSSFLGTYNSPDAYCDDIKDDGADAMAECNDRTLPDGTNFCSFVGQNSDVYSDIFGISEVGRIIRLRKPILVGKLLVNAARCGATSLGSRLQSFSIDVEQFFTSIRDSITSLFD